MYPFQRYKCSPRIYELLVARLGFEPRSLAYEASKEPLLYRASLLRHHSELYLLNIHYYHSRGICLSITSLLLHCRCSRLVNDPGGNRTRISTLKGWCPRPIRRSGQVAERIDRFPPKPIFKDNREPVLPIRRVSGCCWLLTSSNIFPYVVGTKLREGLTASRKREGTYL